MFIVSFDSTDVTMENWVPDEISDPTFLQKCYLHLEHLTDILIETMFKNQGG